MRLRGYSAFLWLLPMTLVLGACTSSHPRAASSTTTGPTPVFVATSPPTVPVVSTTTTVPTAESSTGSSASTTGLGEALLHPTSGVEFFSPSNNISCTILDGPPYPGQSVYCQTEIPPQSVTMSASGSFRTCTGSSCLGNPSPPAPVLYYGDSVVLGPFRCESETVGMTCTASGAGFRISRAGITDASP